MDNMIVKGDYCGISESFIYFLGPICSLCVSSFGARPVTIFSGFMVAGGLMLSGFAPNIYFLFFSYGIVVGKKPGYCNFSKLQELIIVLPMLASLFS